MLLDGAIANEVAFRGAAGSRKARMTIVDGLRGIAALAVVFCHTVGIWVAGAPAEMAPRLIQIFGYGRHGVDVFFVLSGFVIAYSIGSRAVDWRYIGTFILRRSIRLDPPYWCAIATELAVLAIRTRFGHAAEMWPSPSQVLLHFAYLQGIFNKGQIVIVFWTLCIEVQLYLVFVLLLGLAQWVYRKFGDGQRGDAFVVKAVVATYLVSLIWPLGIFRDGWLEPWFVYHWHKFLLGAIISFAAAGRLKLKTAIVCVLICMVVAVIRVWTVPVTTFGSTTGIWVACVTAAFLTVGVGRGALYRWLSWQPLLWVGTVSYSLYLLHGPIIEVLMAMQTRLANGSLVGASIFVGLALIFSLLAAWGLYSAVERPSLRLAARIAKPEKIRIDAPVPGEAMALAV